MQRHTMETVETTVLECFIKTLHPMTVMEIVEDCKLSETIIRQAVNESPRIGHTSRDVKIMSKDYPGHVHQWRSIMAFQPTREWLAEVITKTRTEFEYHKYSTGRGFQ